MEIRKWLLLHRGGVSVSSACAFMALRWPYPRTPWCSVRCRWAGRNMAAAASSSSWAGSAYCPACTGSSRVAGVLWSLDTRCVFSQSSPSWWRLHRAKASANSSTKVRAGQVVTAHPTAAVLQLFDGGNTFAGVVSLMVTYFQVVHITMWHFSGLLLLFYTCVQYVGLLWFTYTTCIAFLLDPETLSEKIYI